MIFIVVSTKSAALYSFTKGFNVSYFSYHLTVPHELISIHQLGQIKSLLIHQKYIQQEFITPGTRTPNQTFWSMAMLMSLSVEVIQRLVNELWLELAWQAAVANEVIYIRNRRSDR